MAWYYQNDISINEATSSIRQLVHKPSNESHYDSIYEAIVQLSRIQETAGYINGYGSKLQKPMVEEIQFCKDILKKLRGGSTNRFNNHEVTIPICNAVQDARGRKS